MKQKDFNVNDSQVVSGYDDYYDNSRSNNFDNQKTEMDIIQEAIESLDHKTRHYLGYIVDAHPNVARKSLYRFGYPEINMDTDDDLFYSMVILVTQEGQKAIDYIITLSPEFSLATNILLNQKKEPNTIKFPEKNFTSTSSITQKSNEYELLIAKNQFNTNLAILGLAAVFLFFAFNKN